VKINNEALTRLLVLKNADKFNEDDEFIYPGAMNEEIKDEMILILNNSIDKIITILKDEPNIDNILEQFKTDLNIFSNLGLDTEDRERVCGYYDEIREIIGFESTNNILNDWLDT
jgi:hypothetical protein